MATELVVTIAPDGNIKMEVNGAVGTSCQLMTKPFEEAFGNTPTSTPKPEMRQTTNETQDARLRTRR